jgi:glycosyltransferase involved in cell wall biosynthesis
MVIIEAMACGTPVISFPEGAAAEIIQPGRNGFLVTDTREVARTVQIVSSLDPHQCRASVLERYAIADVGAAYVTLYRNSTSARRWT